MQRALASVVRSATVAALCGVMMAAVYGCDGIPKSAERVASDEQIDPGSPDRAGAWLFWAKDARFHPLSKIDRSREPPALDVRLEFRDATGEPTKVVGTVILSVNCAGAEPSEQSWKIPLDSLEEHAKHFDPVTATYRIALVPEWTKPPAAGATLTLSAYLFGADGETSTASHRLAW